MASCRLRNAGRLQVEPACGGFPSAPRVAHECPFTDRSTNECSCNQQLSLAPQKHDTGALQFAPVQFFPDVPQLDFPPEPLQAQ